MANRHFSVKHGKVGRGKKHALYIGGQGSYANKDDVVMLLDANMPIWAIDGVDFFDAADKRERANGRTYTEFEFAIPREINDPHAYAQAFAARVLGRFHPYRLAVHDKLASDGGRNIHAHLMFTERKLDGIKRDIDHFFLRANSKNPENGGTGKDRKWNDRGMVDSIRMEYSEFAKSHGVELDLRSNLVQGLNEAEPKVGPIHHRAKLNINRSNREEKVERLRVERILKKGNKYEQKKKNSAQVEVRLHRKQLWLSFQKQRRGTYAKLSQRLKVTLVDEKDGLALIRSNYADIRAAIKRNINLKYKDRRAAISIANMERITQEYQMKAEFDEIRNAIKAEQNEHYSAKYRLFLIGQVHEGDAIARVELDKLTLAIPKQEEVNSIVGISFSPTKDDHTSINLKYQINRSGEVTYMMHGRGVLRDKGERIDLLQIDDLTIETGLRLAQSKFGSKLTLTGSQEFQERTARIAAELGLRVEFADPGINQVMQQHKSELAAQGVRESAVRRTAKSMTQPIAEDAYLQASLAQAQAIALKSGYATAHVEEKHYIGSVIAKTSLHLVQHVGFGKAVIHELAKLGLEKEQFDRIEVGQKREIDYRRAKPLLALSDLETTKLKKNEQGH